MYDLRALSYYAAMDHRLVAFSDRRGVVEDDHLRVREGGQADDCGECADG